jgi:hypothetical protein
VIAIRAAAANVKGEIDLGVGGFAFGHQGAATAGERPVSSLSVMRSASASSA